METTTFFKIIEKLEKIFNTTKGTTVKKVNQKKFLIKM